MYVKVRLQKLVTKVVGCHITIGLEYFKIKCWKWKPICQVWASEVGVVSRVKYDSRIEFLGNCIRSSSSSIDILERNMWRRSNLVQL